MRLVDEISGDMERSHPAAPSGMGCVDFYSCEEAVKRLNEYLDHQLTEEEQVIVVRHLEICRPCLRRFTFEQTLIVSLRQKVACLCMPSTLRAKLHVLLRERSV